MTTLEFDDNIMTTLLEELTRFFHNECLDIKKNRDLMSEFHNEPKKAFAALYPAIDHLLKHAQVGSPYSSFLPF